MTTESPIAVVATFDELSPLLIGAYGNDWVSTEAIDELAAEGVAFTEHYIRELDAKSTWNDWRGGTEAGTSSTRLHQMLSHLGVAERRFLEAGAVAPHTTSGDPHAWTVIDGAGGFDAPFEETSTVRVMEAAREALAHAADSPGRSVIWLHLKGTSRPFMPPHEYASLYFDDFEPEPGEPDFTDESHWPGLWPVAAGASTFIDRAFEPLWDDSDVVGESRPLLFMLTAAAGTPLPNRPNSDCCSYGLACDVVHLPLILWARGDAARCELEPGQRCRAFTQPGDVAATLVEWFGGSSESLPGRSLLRASHEARPAIVYSAPGVGRGVRTAEAAAHRPWSIATTNSTDGATGLFLLPDDPWMMLNVVEQSPDLLERTLAAAEVAAHPQDNYFSTISVPTPASE